MLITCLNSKIKMLEYAYSLITTALVVPTLEKLYMAAKRSILWNGKPVSITSLHPTVQQLNCRSYISVKESMRITLEQVYTPMCRKI